ncbi:hypothetical protein [Rhodoferax saidenbachensis]|uniref:Calcium-dependent cell adhesion molecule N-terminal domain-containing protein n=1 Tax=Rhodoferax saidenbachensis TaxID=1484693 RepID=A0ABU1ZKA0_9BURK|nr:hypothetical protein [Rhodoferax saidenbachensis]MDR7305972.1 hypothetical protein [Rhodoferax saidenbachensis]
MQLVARIFKAVLTVYAVAFGLSCFAQAGLESGAANTPCLRYDGLYRNEQKASDGRPYWQYFRFYADSTAVTVSSTGQVAEILRWFHKDNPQLLSGKVVLRGNALSFVANSTYGAVEFDGVLQGSHLVLNSYSRINQAKGRDDYVFVAFPPQEPPPSSTAETVACVKG